VASIMYKVILDKNAQTLLGGTNHSFYAGFRLRTMVI